MIIRSEPRNESLPTIRTVEISGGRKVGVLPIMPDTMKALASVLSNRYGVQLGELQKSVSSGDITLDNSDNIIKCVIQLYFGIFGFALYDDVYELETPEFELDITEDVDEEAVIEYVKSINKEMKSKFGRAHFTFNDVGSVVLCAVGGGTNKKK